MTADDEVPDFSTNAMYDISRAYKAIRASDQKQPLNAAFVNAFPNTDADADDNKILVLSWFDDAIRLIPFQQIAPERIEDCVATVIKMKKHFLGACSKSSVAEFCNAAQVQSAIMQLDLMGDSVVNSKIDGLPKLDREALLRRTDELSSIIQESPMTEYEKGVLMLKLSAFSRIIRDCAFYSDTEVRGRIKEIYADFSSQFQKHDKKYETIKEAMLRWAKQAGKNGYLAIGLYATGVGIGLLPPVSPILAITGPKS